MIQSLQIHSKGRPPNVQKYTILLKQISQKKATVTELSQLRNESYAITKRMVQLCKNRGFVCVLFDGNRHPVILTEGGREWLKLVGDEV